MMKTLTRNFLPEIFGNSINRNLIFIFTAAMFTAILLVTAAILLVNQ